MITNENISTIENHLVEGRGLRQAIIEEFER